MIKAIVHQRSGRSKAELGIHCLMTNPAFHWPRHSNAQAHRAEFRTSRVAGESGCVSQMQENFMLSAEGTFRRRLANQTPEDSKRLSWHRYNPSLSVLHIKNVAVPAS